MKLYIRSETELMNNKYYVSSITNYGESAGDGKLFSNPGAAIRYWFKQNQKYPTGVSIDGVQNQAVALRAWVVDHEDEVREMAKTIGSPYKIDWLIDECNKPHRPISDKYPDQIHPFSIG